MRLTSCPGPVFDIAQFLDPAEEMAWRDGPL
jgi:hypothetical protein